MIRYFISKETGITYVISYNHARIKNDSDDSSPLKKLTLHIVIFIKGTVKAYFCYRHMLLKNYDFQ